MREAGWVASINVSDGGVPKLAVPSAFVSATGVAGDRQRDRRFHGGPDRAVCLYSLERIQALQGEGHPIAPGTAGENVTIAGLDWDTIAPGTRLEIGEVLLDVLSFTVPCATIRHSFMGERFTRISQKMNPGWSRVYARVVQEGTIRAGDPVVAVTSRTLA